MRISSAGALLLLAACHSQPTDGGNVASIPVTADDDRIGCAHGDAPMTRVCSIDRLEGDGGLVLTVRHPDGAFHRLLVTKDGRGVIAADGAQRAVVTIVVPETIDVAIGGDRYRLPATVKAKSAAS
ncbi:hypothetical protein [uncultured Sphingomonas sp.]|uniref:hypothetical protein n=1 Tax=uncultured Sphingomonas sp. TaxID=158754 RepID=UPI0035CC747D